LLRLCWAGAASIEIDIPGVLSPTTGSIKNFTKKIVLNGR
jgi:hypothetical protein